ILLLLGESGCGKTHLMRAFRNWAHRRDLAYCGYLQMTTATDRYGRYILSNLIDSLERPYYEPRGETSGLIRLSPAMVESATGGRWVTSSRAPTTMPRSAWSRSSAI